jgi:hypothetical protein
MGVSTKTPALVDDAAFGVATQLVLPIGALADETTPDSVTEGDIGTPRMTLDRRLLTAGQILDDASFGVGTAYTTPIAALADETAPDSVDEGDIGAVRMTLDRRLLTAGQILDDASFGVGTAYVSPAALLADEGSPDSVDEGDVGVARMTLDRKAIVTDYAHAAGGATTFKRVATADTNAAVIKGSAGKVYSVVANNQNAAVRYLKLYNKATAPSVGTDTPVLTLALQIASTQSFHWPKGLDFPTGIGMALTTEATDAGSTGVSADEHVVNVAYA